jgi:hypothetical protein
MNIKELLKLRGLDTSANIKLVRHQDARYDLDELYREGHLEVYQSLQGRAVFECKYVVSFVGLEKNRAKFIGVYEVKGRKLLDEVELPGGSPLYQQFSVGCEFWYELEKIPGFEDLVDRVVIDWGKSARSWHQRLTEKEVIEVLSKGYVKEFPGFLDFVITYDELVEIVNNRDANRVWHNMLCSVAGVYLIVDSLTGQQYIGSAYGKRGILGRWVAYAKSGHGGNKKLRELLSSGPGYARNFRFTILQTLDKSLTDREVIRFEERYKAKLGSRVFGLNT